MEHQPPPIQIGTACPLQWDRLSGVGSRRFCGACEHSVHNLSAMSSRQREQFALHTDGHDCIAYELRDDGSMVTAPTPSISFLRELRWKLVALLAALVPFLSGGCARRRHALIGIPCNKPS